MDDEAEMLECCCVGKGGPGRSRSQSRVGMEKMAHQRPTMKSTTRMERVGEVFDNDVLLKMKMMRIASISTKTAAMYPYPTPFELICAERSRSRASFSASSLRDAAAS